MSSRARKLQQKINSILRFPKDMYSNFIGSYMIASYILNHKGDPSHMTEVYKKYCRNPELLKVENEDWLKDLSQEFGVEYDLSGRIVLLSGHNNQLFLIINPETGEIYPIREDGLYPSHTFGEAMEDGTYYVLEEK